MLNRAPLAPAAIALAGGIIAGRYCPWPVGFWLASFAAAAIVAVVALLQPHLRRLAAFCVAAAIFSLGAAWLGVFYFSARADHIVTYTADAAILATVRGQIVSAPVTFADPPSATRSYTRPPRTGFILSARQIRGKAGWQRATGLVRVTVDEPAYHLAAGAEVQIPGWLGRYRQADNPGQYDRAKAARLNHTLAWLRSPAAEGVTILAGDDPTWHKRMLWNVRASTRQHLLGLGGRTEGHVLNALLIGQRHPALMTLNRTMMRTGIGHFMSISGLHMGIFLGFVYLLFRICAFSPRRASWIVLVILTGYVLLAEPRAPLLRSAIMAAALCLGQILGRRVAALNALALAAIVLLVIDPAQLFQAGFQLSFVIVAGVLLLHRPVHDLLFGKWLKRRGLMVFRSAGRRRRWVGWKLSQWLMGAVSMSLVAYLTAWPLVAYHFSLFSPLAPALSLLLLPLLAAVLVPGYLSVALAWPMPNLSFWIGRLAAMAAEALNRTAEAFGRVGGLSWDMRSVGAGWVVACYAAIAVIAFRRKLSLRWPPTVAIVLLAAGWTVWSQLPARSPDVAQLNILSVGAGQCAVLRTPSGKTFIFDAGTRSGLDVYEQALKPFYRHQKLPAPQVAFVSHANTDHFNGLWAPAKRAQLKLVYINRYFRAHARQSASAAELLATLYAKGSQVIQLAAGDSFQLDSRTSVEVLWPPVEIRDDLSVNDTSLVLRIRCDDKSVLLTGDLDETGQAALAADPAQLRCDALLVPHHGGWAESLPDFVAATGAPVVLVSNSRNPTPPAGNKRAGRFYAQLPSGYQYLSTARNGWIQLSFGAGKMEVNTMR